MTVSINESFYIIIDDTALLQNCHRLAYDPSTRTIRVITGLVALCYIIIANALRGHDSVTEGITHEHTLWSAYYCTNARHAASNGAEYGGFCKVAQRLARTEQVIWGYFRKWPPAK